MCEAMLPTSNPNRNIPTLHIHGTEDNYEPWEGTDGPLYLLSVDETVNHWVELNDCSPFYNSVSLPDLDASDDCTVEKRCFYTNDGDTTVILIKVNNGGHNWPGASENHSWEGNKTGDIDANYEIWNFFSKHYLVFEVDETPPETPTNLEAVVDSTNNSVILSWSLCNASDLEMYNIYRSITDNVDSANYLCSIACTDTSYTDFTAELPLYYYWVTAVDKSGNESSLTSNVMVDVDELNNTFTTNFSLQQNYPNPFNPVTTIKYNIPLEVRRQKAEVRNVRLVIYDVLGREVATLVNEKQKPGNYEVEFNAYSGSIRNLTSGIYIYRLITTDYTKSIKMVYLK